MPDRKMLVPHLEADAVYAAYRGERDAVRRTHLQVVWLLLSGRRLAEVSAVTGLCGRWILKLMDRWNEQALEGLGDRRRSNAGAEPLLDAAGLAALVEALEADPADGGLWSGRQVASWMSAYLGRAVSPKRGLDYLHRLGYSLQQPRPRHAKAAGPEDSAAFKKNSARRWRRRGAKRPAGRSRSGPSTSIASA